LAALRSCHVKLQRIPSFPVRDSILCFANMPATSSCTWRFNVSVGDGLGFRVEDFPRPRRSARPL